MSLARALTRRVRNTDGPTSPNRTMSHKVKSQPSVRHKISAPVELLSTTNMLSFNAPDIRSVSSSSRISGSDSDVSAVSSVPTPDTSTDASSIESPPTSPETNHLSCYFPTPKSPSRSSSVRQSTSSTEDAPAIPQRALSHTAATHKALARKRSQRMSPPTSIHTLRTSTEMFSSKVDASHPFGKELEQVNELAEEFGVKDRVLDEEEQYILSRGLRKFAAEDYAMEIGELYGGVFEDRLFSTSSRWI